MRIDHAAERDTRFDCRIGVGGCYAGYGDDAAQCGRVPIFSQQELTVSVGDTVTFENDSTIPHTVTNGQDGEAAADAQFDEDVPTGESVEIAFEEAAT